MINPATFNSTLSVVEEFQNLNIGTSAGVIDAISDAYIDAISDAIMADDYLAYLEDSY